MFWHILGILPTTDIAEIKKAYASLAKKYNPEEHPEEFQKIHSAYRSALDYAQRSTTDKLRSDAHEAAPISVNEAAPYHDKSESKHAYTTVFYESQNNKSADREFDFSDTPTKSERQAITDKSTALDFSSVFEDNASVIETISDISYDFTQFRETPLEASVLTKSQKIGKAIERFTEIINDDVLRNSPLTWNNYFTDPQTKEVIDKPTLRRRIKRCLKGKKFSSLGAKALASCLGGKAMHFPADSPNAEYVVSPDGIPPKNIGQTLRHSIIPMIFGCMFVLFAILINHLPLFDNPKDSDAFPGNIYDSSAFSGDYYKTYFQEVSALFEKSQEKPLSEFSFEFEELHRLGEGSWNSLGSEEPQVSLQINSDSSYTLTVDKNRYEGIAQVTAPDNGTNITFLLSGSDHEYTVSVYLSDSGMLYSFLIDTNGNPIRMMIKNSR